MRYRFSEGDKFAQPNTYFYTAYGGAAFLDAWRASRGHALAALPPATRSAADRKELPTAAPYSIDELLAGILSVLEYGPGDERGEALEKLSHLTRRYERSKRLHETYAESWVAQGAECSAAAYVTFAEALAAAYAQSHALTYLNALLKLLDQLISVRQRLPETLRGRLARVLVLEREHVEQLAARVSPRAAP
ncbi:MAG: hypothetical protein A2Z64_05895 [Betaproteobacteria bacterium RIFCSPLOWO2_02_67_12]|nr:MAG: hypothetical protein A2Z64_05895 [Betaproteobacteria bacterium RIFCSPLOWO2_02_67_12]OGA26540.1 MAG: hypothetical protein A3I65_05495 [Betaproteobacteria bacterium RIFCSPLOWO2_02_FULL_68_150]OGA68243.1 MAG: hypothetical protein A3F77_11305 [Betaproteobacteria bacterium RIFCSPLOWO2_12_FULL_67_28]